MPILIHNKEYVTVAERLQEAREDIQSIITEVVPDGGLVVVKATVTTKKGVFTGISAANPGKLIEKQSPYEVAETSAVGRALGFAGYGAVESIASADEVVKATSNEEWLNEQDSEREVIKAISSYDYGVCPKCGAANLKSFKGKIYCGAKCWLNPTLSEPI